MVRHTWLTLLLVVLGRPRVALLLVRRNVAPATSWPCRAAQLTKVPVQSSGHPRSGGDAKLVMQDLCNRMNGFPLHVLRAALLLRHARQSMWCFGLVTLACGVAQSQVPQGFDLHIEKAWAAFHGARPSEAELEFSEAQRYAPLRDGDYCGLSLSQKHQGKLTEAAASAREGYKRYPDQHSTVIRFCEALFDIHDYDRARAVARVMMALPVYNPLDPVMGTNVDRLCDREYEVTYRLDRRWLDREGLALVEGRPLRCPLPTDVPYQKTISVNIIGAARVERKRDPQGGWEFADIDPADGNSCSVVIRITRTPYLFEDLSGPMPAGADAVLPEVRRFLGRTADVDPALPCARAAGATVARAEWAETVLAAQRWMNANLAHYDDIRDKDGLVLPPVSPDLPYSEKVLVQKVSRCGGLSCAMAAVLRAAGVPTRITGGAPGLPDDGPLGFHTWLECWHHRAGWVPFDGGVALGPAPQYYRLGSEVGVPEGGVDFYGVWLQHRLPGVAEAPIWSKLIRKWLDTSDVFADAAAGDVQAVQTQLAKRASLIRATDIDHGATPLHFAAFAGKLDVVKALLAAGAEVEARNDAGRTPLHNAAFAGADDVVRLLLDKGANLQARDAEGRTPREWAVAQQHAAAAAILAEAELKLTEE